MSLVLEYRNTRADFRTHYEILAASSYRTGRSEYYRSVAFWTAVVLLGAYAAFSAGQVFLMFLLLTMGGFSLARPFSYARKYWAAVDQLLSDRPETQIRLRVEEDGLHESMGGIESFVPWASVKRFTVFRDTLFIELGAALWAIVPRTSVSTNPGDYDTLIQLLRDRGIEEAPNPQGGARRRRPFSPETNRTSGAAGPGR